MTGIQVGLRKPGETIGGHENPPDAAPVSRSTAGVLYFLMLMPGLLGCMFARAKYQLLDDSSALGLMIAFFLLPFVIQLVGILRKQSNARLLRIAFSSAGCALVVLAMLLFVNGGADKSPSTVMRARVTRKTVLTGRHGARQYVLKVSSWRPGRKSEDLNVSSRVFQRAEVARDVAIEVHPGYLGYAWSGRIAAE